MRNKVGDKQRLLHILDAIGEIEKYTDGVSQEEFMGQSMMRFACIKQIEIIGEAANAITSETKDLFSTVQWQQVIGMRNILVHEYLGIDVHLIWQVILNDLPPLKQNIETIINSLSD